MRSFFNKPSWASQGAETGNSEFYRRSGHTYEDIIATKKTARERRVNASRPSPQKRRRFSSSSNAEGTEDSDIGEATTAEKRTTPGGLPLLESPVDDNAHTSASDIQLGSILADQTPPADKIVPKSPSFQDSLRSASPQSIEREERTPSLSTDAISNVNTETHTADSTRDTTTPAEANASRSEHKTGLDNAVVQILITSKIANTRPLVIHRKMSQSLKGVRLAWCIHQDLPTEMHPSIFLTWKGRRLFDVTTCRSLNINTRSAFNKDIHSFDELFGDSKDIRIHMEAVTESSYAAGYQTSPNIVESDPTTPPSTELQDTDQETWSEIVLKCPGYGDLKIRVSSNTRVFQIITSFREARGISKEFDVYLAFDGDRLDPCCCLTDCEIDDGDLVDVLVRKPV
ncbi:ubiquitin-2 like Rad60 SUMO-like-domain-containing protein [Aspergillus heterothallicus]